MALSLLELDVSDKLEWVPGKSWGSKQAHHVIHQLVTVVSQCGAGAWLNGLASGDQRRLTGSSSAPEACLRWCAIQIHRYFNLSNSRQFAAGKVINSLETLQDQCRSVWTLQFGRGKSQSLLVLKCPGTEVSCYHYKLGLLRLWHFHTRFGFGRFLTKNRKLVFFSVSVLNMVTVVVQRCEEGVMKPVPLMAPQGRG